MMRSRRRGDESQDYPIFEMFGPEPRRLTHEEAISATVERRIESVWLFLVRKTLQFVATLRGQEVANCDPEDILVELYIELQQKDGKWEPDRGRYITFVGRLVQRHLSDLRDKSRTVKSPRNSSSRMGDYQRELDAGTITAERLQTYRDIQRSTASYTLLSSRERGDGVSAMPELAAPAGQGDDEAIESRENGRISADAVTWGIMSLTPFEARVLGMSGGLWNQPSLTVGEIAEKTGRKREAVKKAKERAFAKVRQRLTDMGHPAIASDN